jgi:hypothetical protein
MPEITPTVNSCKYIHANTQVKTDERMIQSGEDVMRPSVATQQWQASAL